ncbi:CST complex subunit Ten1 [Annulohypoxylon maeteangense]|uniref:CST complex subunit Ten1 n=1 Tax=Annulohypoxylon maeteangense TaxID=1927788 RepID=UPI00200881DB|nr:CST complex subunit Ten1 [Annulohypoxylon maeteangense]KAI0885777.1 CST complex subunit Ten1 [Annulohypoxylon maeteangense]
MMSNGPPPSVRCLLGDLHRHRGEKVRFLGCVTYYNTHSASLTLEHEYKGNKMPAYVDVKLLLETLKSEQLEIGQWVHVIGYVTSFQILMTKSKEPRCSSSVHVQALVLWTAEDLDISSYEKAFASNRVADRTYPSQSSSAGLVE